jgi:UDP-N-acetylmuramoylalanine--D-glutamate ligase
MTDFKKKKFTVVGLGEKTGVWLARYLIKGGAKVFITEMKKREELIPAWNLVSQLDAEFEFGGHSIEKVAGSTAAVICPGVPIDSPFLLSIRKMGIEVLSELEFAYRNLIGGKIIAVTGTNGKSTTVTMLDGIFKEWGKKTFVGGNLGDPLVEALALEAKYDYYVVEVSTFQLEGATRFKPDIGVLLNVSANHLDRHGSMESYVDLKSKLFTNQKPSDTAILNYDNSYTEGISRKLKSKLIRFSLNDKRSDLFVYAGKLTGPLLGAAETISLDQLSLKGNHNVENFMAATAASIAAGVPLDAVKGAMGKFKPLPHRIEFVREFKKVKYFDDSKSTTVDSTIKAIQSMEGCFVFVAGGRDKGSDFSILKEHLKDRARAIVLFGEAAQKMEAELKGVAPLAIGKSFEDAVEKARDMAKSGDSVLLSPANTSFDLFKDYKARGDMFKRIVDGF